MNGTALRGVCWCVAVVAGASAVVLSRSTGVQGQAAAAGIHDAVRSGDAGAVNALLDKTHAAVNSKKPPTVSPDGEYRAPLP